ncbi:hypothetical protein KQ313_07850 [Synechococcus sp. CS-1325]|uniref:hypothetical protein n=1 Tax=Synechococcus sp. CS-1325 TaxID=2847979 RepID=UPI00223C2933|nr:hypothetical protein [Synechococcus sp. CS-1325]MCT0199587.1 hypothetical protein [Synechococcus sp. CS-1325]
MSTTRDQSVLIRQLVERADFRLLLTTYAFYKGPFIKELFQGTTKNYQSRYAPP